MGARLIGFFRWMKLVWRIVLAKKHLRNIQSVVSIGAPIEILFGPGQQGEFTSLIQNRTLPLTAWLEKGDRYCHSTTFQR